MHVFIHLLCTYLNLYAERESNAATTTELVCSRIFRKTLGLLFGSLTKKVQSKRLTNTQQPGPVTCVLCIIVGLFVYSEVKEEGNCYLLPSLQIKQIDNTQVCMN